MLSGAGGEPAVESVIGTRPTYSCFLRSSIFVSFCDHEFDEHLLVLSLKDFFVGPEVEWLGNLVEVGVSLVQEYVG